MQSVWGWIGISHHLVLWVEIIDSKHNQIGLVKTLSYLKIIASQTGDCQFSQRGTDRKATRSGLNTT